MTMAYLVNTTRKTLNIGGIQLPPLGMGESNVSSSELRDHLFVRSGWVEMNTGTASVESKPKRRGKRSEPKQDEDTQDQE